MQPLFLPFSLIQGHRRSIKFTCHYNIGFEISTSGRVGWEPLPSEVHWHRAMLPCGDLASNSKKIWPRHAACYQVGLVQGFEAFKVGKLQPHKIESHVNSRLIVIDSALGHRHSFEPICCIFLWLIESLATQVCKSNWRLQISQVINQCNPI